MTDDLRRALDAADEAIAQIERRSEDRRRKTPKIECPHCGHLVSIVKNSRPTVRKDGVIRRRQCLQCDKRYSTSEVLIGRYSKAS